MNKLLIIVSLISSIILSQESTQENKKNNALMLSINYAFQIPEGDMAERFGNNSDISITVFYKTNDNFILSVEGGVLFGPTVKENNPFQAIDGNDGNLISQNGEIPTIRLFERGAHIDISFGKYFKFPNSKNESGIMVSFGTGYMYHKIFIETLITQLPQLDETLLKGYDRLCGGWLTKQFIGYLYFSNTNNIRYFFGLETVQGFTKDLRGYSYTTQRYITNKRIDYLIGIKCGFIIPIKQRESERYYYY